MSKFVYCVFGLDGVLKDTRFILVQAECPYVQFVAAAHVTLQGFTPDATT